MKIKIRNSQSYSEYLATGKNPNQRFAVTTTLPGRHSKHLQFWFAPLIVFITLSDRQWIRFIKFLKNIPAPGKIFKGYITSGFHFDRGKAVLAEIGSVGLSKKVSRKSILRAEARTRLGETIYLHKGEDCVVHLHRSLFLKIKRTCLRFDTKCD